MIVLLKILDVEFAVVFVEYLLLLVVGVDGFTSSQVSETNRTFSEGAMISSAVVPSTRTFSDHVGA